MASWWDSISSGMDSVTDWLGGSGGKALSNTAGLIGAGFDIYGGIKNQSLANKYGDLAFSSAEQQDRYASELWERQKQLNWPLEDLQARLSMNQLNLALDPQLWNNYAYSQQVGSNYSSKMAELAADQLYFMEPLYRDQASYARSRGYQDLAQQQAIDSMMYENEKSVIRKLTEGEDVLRDRMMDRARDDTTVSFANQSQNLQRQLGLAGVGSSSQQATNAMTQMNQQQALAEASNRTMAARAAEDTSLSRQSQALNYWKGAALPQFQYTPQASLSGMSTGGGQNYTSSALGAQSSSLGAFAGLAGQANQNAQSNWTGLGSTMQNLTGQDIKN